MAERSAEKQAVGITLEGKMVVRCIPQVTLTPKF